MWTNQSECAYTHIRMHLHTIKQCSYTQKHKPAMISWNIQTHVYLTKTSANPLSLLGQKMTDHTNTHAHMHACTHIHFCHLINPPLSQATEWMTWQWNLLPGHPVGDQRCIWEGLRNSRTGVRLCVPWETKATHQGLHLPLDSGGRLTNEFDRKSEGLTHFDANILRKTWLINAWLDWNQSKHTIQNCPQQKVCNRHTDLSTLNSTRHGWHYVQHACLLIWSVFVALCSTCLLVDMVSFVALCSTCLLVDMVSFVALCSTCLLVDMVSFSK